MTKRADQLLQKANVYEKLALFGSRKNFLSAIAQEVRLVFPPANLVEALKPVEAKLQGVVRQVSEQMPQSGQYLGNLQAALNSLGNLMQSAYVTTLADLKGKADALATQLMNVRSGAYGIARAPGIRPELQSYLTQLSDDASAAYDIMMKDPNVAKVMGQTPEETAPVATNTSAPAAAGLPKISTEEQEALSKVFVIEGGGLPLKIDGFLGPETQKAIDFMRKKWNVPNYTNQQMLTWMGMQAKLPKYQ